MQKGKIKKNIIQILILLALMCLTYYIIMRDKDIDQVWSVLAGASGIWLMVSALSMVLYIFCGGWAIRVLMKGRGKKVSIWQCFKYSFIEFYFSAITPSSSGGQPVQVFYMSKDGYDVADSGVCIVTITILYKGALLVIAAIAFALELGFISGAIANIWPLAILGLFLNLGLIAILVMLLFSKKMIGTIAKFFIRFLGKIRIVKDTDRLLDKCDMTVVKYHACAKFLASHKPQVIKAFGVLSLQRLSLMLIPFFVYKSFGLSGYSLVQILAAQCLLNICVDMMPLPGAVGISETVFFILFTPIFLEQNITTAVLLSRGISFYVVVIVAGLVVCGIQLADIIRNNISVRREKKENQ